MLHLKCFLNVKKNGLTIWALVTDCSPSCLRLFLHLRHLTPIHPSHCYPSAKPPGPSKLLATSGKEGTTSSKDIKQNYNIETQWAPGRATKNGFE